MVSADAVSMLTEQSAIRVALVERVTGPSGQAYHARAIETIRTGQRVLASNPQLAEADLPEAPVDPTSWVNIHLRMAQATCLVLQLDSWQTPRRRPARDHRILPVGPRRQGKFPRHPRGAPLAGFAASTAAHAGSPYPGAGSTARQFADLTRLARAVPQSIASRTC
jgi:hypothetical protein